MLLTFLTGLRNILQIRVLAAGPPDVVCTGLPGCSGGASTNVLFENAIPVGIEVLINLAAAGAVIFIVVAGIQMLLSMGDESKITSARWGILYALLGLALGLMSQALVSFVATEDYGQGSGEFLFQGALPSVIRIILMLFNVTFALVIMIAGFRMALSLGKTEEYQKALTVIRWAIGGAVVTNAAHALVQALLAISF